jgi:hypothetical protein
MKHRTALAVSLGIVFSGLVAAQPEEFARLVRNGEQATLSVFGPRPVDLAAQKLVDEFSVVVNVEDPFYVYRDDVQDITTSRGASLGRRWLIPKAASIEIRIDLRPDGSLQDARQVLVDLVETANAQLPFAYRIERDGDTFTLVPTRTRDEQGRSVEMAPILDRHVTIPLGTRKIFEQVNLLTHALEEQTGFHIACCQTNVGGIPWGSTVVSFEARDEPARSAFLRLVRSEPKGNHLVRIEPGRYHLVPNEPGGYYWHMRCTVSGSSDPAPPAGTKAWCFINVANIPNRP